MPKAKLGKVTKVKLGSPGMVIRSALMTAMMCSTAAAAATHNGLPDSANQAIELADTICLASTGSDFTYRWQRSDWHAHLEGRRWKVWTGDEDAPVLVVFISNKGTSGCYVQYLAYHSMTRRP